MTLDRKTVIDELTAIFDRATDGRVSGIEITEQQALINDLGLQSLDILEIAFEIEKKWGFTIGDETYNKLRSSTGLLVSDLVDFVVEQSAAKNAVAAPAEA